MLISDFCKANALFFLIVIVLLPLQLSAAQELFVRKPIEVYESDSEISTVIRHLEKGDRVPISGKAYGEWRKVLIRVKGELTPGWVSTEALKGQVIEDKRTDRAIELDKIYHGHFGVGFEGTFSFLSQSSRKYSDPSGTTVSIDSMSGSTVFFGVFGDFPVSSTFVIRADVNLRTTSFHGSFAFLNGSSNPYDLRQTFVGIGLTGKFYSDKSSNVWIGAGVEGAKATSVNLSFTQNAVPLYSATDFPFYLIVHGDIGIDIPISSDFYILPLLRAGVIPTANPIFLVGEATASVAYRF
jgi:hypothetical protein